MKRVAPMRTKGCSPMSSILVSPPEADIDQSIASGASSAFSLLASAGLAAAQARQAPIR
jgi:hypothetical protein